MFCRAFACCLLSHWFVKDALHFEVHVAPLLIRHAEVRCQSDMLELVARKGCLMCRLWQLSFGCMLPTGVQEVGSQQNPVQGPA